MCTCCHCCVPPSPESSIPVWFSSPLQFATSSRNGRGERVILAFLTKPKNIAEAYGICTPVADILANSLGLQEWRC